MPFTVKVRKYLILFFFSFLLTAIPLYNLAAQVDLPLIISNKKTEQQKPLPPLLDQGKQISINDRKFSVAWIQWQEGSLIHTGLSDIGASQTLGLQLLSTKNPFSQPVNWFSDKTSLATLLISPFRYLDITDLLLVVAADLKNSGDTLNINFIPAQIDNIRLVNSSKTSQIVIDLNRPTFWQVHQIKNEGVVSINAIASPLLLNLFPQNPDDLTPTTATEEEELSAYTSDQLVPLLRLQGVRDATKLSFSLPKGANFQVSSLSNPHQIIIDISPDALVKLDISWSSFLSFHRQLITLNKNEEVSSKIKKFIAVWLEINLQSSQVSLKPITSKENGLEGIYPLIKTARISEAVAAINGGFFNRNYQQPLGAIRVDNYWLSGPILNRGAIAWDNQGTVKISRLSLQETLATSNGNHLSVSLLNTGYVQEGIARYTKAWGETYTPLIDNETIVSIEDNQVTQIQAGGKSQEKSFPIPINGFLLSFRHKLAFNLPLAIGTKVKLQTQTLPLYLESYPYILGAGPILLQNRQIILNPEAEKFSAAFAKQAASRSAIAVTKEKTLLLVAIHNLPGESSPTLKQLAQIMKNLGAIDALNLDGGSSTSLYLGGNLIDRNPATAARVHNGIGIFISP